METMDNYPDKLFSFNSYQFSDKNLPQRVQEN